MLSARRLLITGVVTRRSIAFEAARRAQLAGAEVVLSGFGRSRRLTERAAEELPEPVEILELDVNSDEDIVAVAEQLKQRWGALDGLLHAVAFAPPDALGGDFLGASREGATIAFQTSAYSLKALAQQLAPLLAAGEDGAGGSIVGLDFDAGVAWPVYDWMGVAKAALESVARYLARDLGAEGIRVNLVSAGPIETLAAGGIPGFEALAASWAAVAPLAWDVKDAGPVADAICFLLSGRSRGITAEILHVDGGYHAMGRSDQVSETVLLSGATGFLGMELLARLLERDDEDEVIVLVRASDKPAAAERLRHVLGRLYEQPPASAERVRAIPADVSLTGLGLGATDRRDVLAQTSSIIHCAASIAFDLPLAQARNVNAGGTARVLELARELDGAGRLRRVVHVSTAYVCGRHLGVFGEGPAPAGASFRNSYEQSKADSERIASLAGDGLPLALARPSIVVGDSRCGWTPSFNVVYWPLQAFARGLIDQVPADPEGTLDIVPVDYVAEGILALHDEAELLGTINLVAGANAVSNRRLLELACAHFERAAAPFVRDGALPGVREAEVYLPYFDVRAQFTDERARQLLQPRGIECPPLERYFSTLMDYAARARWGKRSPTREAAHAGTAGQPLQPRRRALTS